MRSLLFSPQSYLASGNITGEPMPQLLAALMTLEAKYFNRHSSQTSVNVLHYSVSGVGGASLTDQQVVNELSTLVGPLYKALMGTGSTYLGARLQKIDPAPVPVAVTSTNATGVGTAGANSAPAQAAALITKRTSLAGRRNRGRVYLPFIADSHLLASGELAAGGLAAVNAWATWALNVITITVGGNSVTLSPVVFNRNPIGSVLIVSNTVRAQLATQRRRSLVNRGDALGP